MSAPTLDERVPCPACGERIAPFAAQCRYCDEFLLPATRAARERVELRASLVVGLASGCGLLLLVLVVAGVAAGASVPALQRIHKRGHERSAVAALRTIATAEARLSATPAEEAQPPGFGDLSALARAQLIDRELASGLRDGYQFEVTASDIAPAERWIAIASPVDPGRSGDRWFAINHSGAVYALRRPFPLDAQTCEVPPDAVPLGEGEWE